MYIQPRIGVASNSLAALEDAVALASGNTPV